MSIKSALRWRHDECFEDGRKDPILTITIEGWSDVVRFTEHMACGQVEFCEEANRIRARIGRKFGIKRTRELIGHFTGRVPLR